MDNKRLNSRQRRISPALIGAGVSGLGNLVNMFSANAQAKKQQEALLGQFWNNKELEDANILNEYDTTGTSGIQYYANGGKINKGISPTKYNTTGGDLVPISDGVDMVVGNTHGENKIDGTYGVQLQEGGVPVAEVEDGEVIVDDTAVFSNRLMFNNKHSYADKMKQIASKRNKLDTELDGIVPTRKRNRVERQLAGLNMAEEALYAKQETHKMQEGIDELSKLAAGGKIPGLEDLYLEDDLINKMGYSGGDTANRRILKDANNVNNKYSNLLGDESLLGVPNDYVSSIPNNPMGVISYNFTPSTGGVINPAISASTNNAISGSSSSDFLSGNAPMFIDNLANAAINLSSPRVPKPILNAVPRLNTRVNVAPRVASVNNAVSSITDNISRNTSNSAIARSGIANSRFKGAEVLSQIYGDKENIEKGLQNQQEQLNYANKVGNNNLLNSTAIASAENRAGQLKRTSANFANIADDLTGIQERKDLDKYYDEDLLNQLLDDTTGEKRRTVKKSPYLLNRLKRAGATSILNN